MNVDKKYHSISEHPNGTPRDSTEPNFIYQV